MNSTVYACRCLGLALIMSGLAGCGCRNEPPRAPQPLPRTPASHMASTQTPTTPRPQTPTSPRPPQTPTAPPNPMKPAPILGLEAMRQVKEGMSHQEVTDLLGMPGFVMSKTGEETMVYRWTDPKSATLLARFENGKLTRKNVIAANGAGASEQASLSEEDYHAITPGMSLEEVLLQIGVEPKSQNMGRDGASIVRWADANGSSFTARFQDRKLVRKTGFHVSRKQSSAPAAPPEAPPVENAPLESKDVEAPSEEESPPAAEPVSDEADEQNSAPEKSPRVRTTVSTRRDDKGASSYNPKAKLPEFAHGLREGAFEVRISNPTGSKVKAGLRSGNRGIDVTLPPRSSRSVKVDRGTYGFYFISDDDPYTVNGGNGVDLTSMFASDIEISIIDENYEVRLLNGAS